MPALKDTENKWVLQAEDKANLYADTFSKKCFLNAVEVNEYSKLPAISHRPQGRLKSLLEKTAEDVMDKLQVDSGTGPDLLPARILKYCAAALAKPVLLLRLS